MSKHNYVLFYDRIANPKRKEQIRQFKNDPGCRVFLSTDASGLGLNLQNDTAIINMDLPRNPALLEQHIGRIHCLGQHQPIRVVNFVAQGTIEHGMLSLLSFKQSLFSGVLDKGKDEAFLGGTRLKSFMDSVDKATSAIPESMPQQDRTEGDGDGTDREVSVEIKEKEVWETMQKQAWDDLVSTGLSFLDKLGQTLLGENGEQAITITIFTIMHNKQAAR